MGSVITIKVGIKPDCKTFMLHEHALRSSSRYFVTAMNAQCAAADDKQIALPSFRVDDFAVYAKFLYTGLLFTKDTGNAAELTRCLHLFGVAKHLEAYDFQDALIDAIIEYAFEFRALKGQCRFTANQISTIYSVTEEASSLRRFAQDLYLQSKSPECFEKGRLKNFPAEFQLDLLAAAAPYITSSAKSTDMQDPLDLTRSCKYHEHTERGSPCYKKKYQFMLEEPSTAKEPRVTKAPSLREVAKSVSESGDQRQQTEGLTSNDFELKV